jgi:hypothetical protein
VRTPAALLLLFVATVVRADNSVSPDLDPAYYDTELQAATAGLQMAYDRSNAYEYAGVILRTTNGKFRVSRPDTDYRGDAVQIDFDNDYAGYEVVADYHTHPCLPYSHWPAVFSDRDANSNDFDATVGYMGDLCSGVIRRYVPGVTPRDMSWSNSPLAEAIAAKEGIDLRGSHGEAVGQITLNPKLPVLQEIPGPKTKARGLNCW